MTSSNLESFQLRVGQTGLTSFSALVHSSLDAAVLIDQQGCVLEWNVIAENLFGWSSAEASGAVLQALIFPEQSRGLLLHNQTPFLNEDETWLLAKRILVDASHHDGIVFPVELTECPLKANGQWYFVSFIRDLSTARQVDAIRSESEQRFRDFAEVSADWFFELDDKLRFSYLSEGRELSSAVASVEVLGRTAWELDPSRLNDRRWQTLIFALRNNRHFSDVEIDWRTKGEESRTFRVSGKPIFDAAGDLRGWRGTGVAITDFSRPQGQHYLRTSNNDLTGLAERLEDASLVAGDWGEQQWISRITRAIDESRLTLYAQQIDPVNALAGDGDHIEVLLRMRDVDEQLLLPSTFMPTAERYGLATRIDRWVVGETFAWLRRHPRYLQELYQISVNLSGCSLGDSEFLNYLLQTIEENGIASQKLCFEVTETAAISNIADAVSFMTRIRQLGCQFALDDFGSGLSSFGYLKSLPVDILKIDGLFVRDIDSDPVALALVKSINEIGHVMGMKTVAEFVETERILEQLMILGVDYVQGFAIAKPCSLDSLVRN